VYRTNHCAMAILYFCSLCEAYSKFVNSENVETVGPQRSYIIIPIILADGLLVSPLYIILKELTGTFGPRMLEILFQLIFTSKLQDQKNSTSEHFKTWFSEVCLLNTGRKNFYSTRRLGTLPEPASNFQPFKENNGSFNL